MIDTIRNEIQKKIEAAQSANNEHLLRIASLEEAAAKYQAEAENAETPEAMASAQSRKAFAERQLAALKAEPKAMAYASKDEALDERKRLYAAWASEAKPIYKEMQEIMNSLAECYNRLVSVNKNGEDVLDCLGHQRPFEEYICPLYGHPLMIPRNLYELGRGNSYAAEISIMIDRCNMIAG